MKKIPVYGIDDFAEGKDQNFFYANDLSTHLKSHQFVNLPHKHNTYISLLFTNGAGKHYIDFDTYQVKPGTVFLLRPGQVHSWTLSKDVKGFVFIHTKEFYDTIFANRKLEDFPFFYHQQNYPAIYLKQKDGKKIEYLFNMIIEKYQDYSNYKISKLGSTIDLIYLELADLYPSKEQLVHHSKPNLQRVKNLQMLIDKNYKSKKFPNDYADLMNISMRHLNRITQETLNKTTGDLIFERTMLEAKRILSIKDIPIAQVAEELGYDDVSYFIRLFKKQNGMSPKEFQNRLSL